MEAATIRQPCRVVPACWSGRMAAPLLLDEVSDMPLETQGKIVRALQDQTFERIGGSSRVKVDVRVLATTNRDLQAEIAAVVSARICSTGSLSCRFACRA